MFILYRIFVILDGLYILDLPRGSVVFTKKKFMETARETNSDRLLFFARLRPTIKDLLFFLNVRNFLYDSLVLTA